MAGGILKFIWILKGNGFFFKKATLLLYFCLTTSAQCIGDTEGYNTSPTLVVSAEMELRNFSI